MKSNMKRDESLSRKLIFGVTVTTLVKNQNIAKAAETADLAA